MLRRLFLVCLLALAVTCRSPHRRRTAGWSGWTTAPTPTIPTTTPKVKFVSMGKGFSRHQRPGGHLLAPEQHGCG